MLSRGFVRTAATGRTGFERRSRAPSIGDMIIKYLRRTFLGFMSKRRFGHVVMEFFHSGVRRERRKI
jgi:hypothetical protein